MSLEIVHWGDILPSQSSRMKETKPDTAKADMHRKTERKHKL